MVHFWTTFWSISGHPKSQKPLGLTPKPIQNWSKTDPEPIKKWSKSWSGGSKMTSKNPKFGDFCDKKHTFLDPEKPVFWPILGSWDILWNGVMPNPGPKNRYLVGASSNFPYGPFCAVFGHPIFGGPKMDQNGGHWKKRAKNVLYARMSKTRKSKKTRFFGPKRWSGGHKNRFLEVKIDPQNPFFDPFLEQFLDP